MPRTKSPKVSGVTEQVKSRSLVLRRGGDNPVSVRRELIPDILRNQIGENAPPYWVNVDEPARGEIAETRPLSACLTPTNRSFTCVLTRPAASVKELLRAIHAGRRWE